MAPEHKLHWVKLAHTVIWAFFAGCVVGIPVFVVLGRLEVAAVLIAVVLGEVLVLAFNGMRCPLTDVAGRYTTERQANFDIYLPLWLARHNQRIFGTLYAAGVAYTAAAWWAGR
ncbi:MAG TPA: hypothetical protein DCW87_05310 [Comamonadaceae bacterium]|nr:hypothetical protein [Comamonadaceae bacterium]